MGSICPGYWADEFPTRADICNQDKGGQNTKTVIQRLVLGAVVAIAVPLAAVAGSVKVGFNAPLTGFAAADGNSALIGAQLAVEQVNAAGKFDQGCQNLS